MRRFRTFIATPASPAPNSSIVAGSGTGVTLMLSIPESSVVLKTTLVRLVKSESVMGVAVVRNENVLVGRLTTE